MNIVYVLNSYLPFTLGGTEMFTHTLAGYMIHKGHNVSVVIPGYRVESQGAYYIHEQVQVYSYFESSKPDRNLILGLQKTNGLKNFTDVIQTLNPEIVHFQMISSGACITEFHLEEVKKLGYKTILTLHLSHYTCLTENLLVNNRHLCNGLIKQQKCTTCYLVNKNIPKELASISALVSNSIMVITGFRQALFSFPIISSALLVHSLKNRLLRLEKNLDAFIAINSWYKKILIINGIPPHKVIKIDQGLVPAHGGVLSEISESQGPILKLVFVGRIAKIKGLHLVLEALKKIGKELYLFDIYGATDSKSEYFDQCNKLVLKYDLNVRFKGTLPRSEVKHTLQNYDFLCLPSLFSEMSPLVIQEAFDAGIPVIGSNVPGITEGIKDGENGLIFKFGNIEELNTIIMKVIKSPGIKFTLRKNIKAPKTFEEVGNENLNVYQKILSQY